VLWLTAQTAWRAPRRLLLAAVAVAFPVGTLGATLLYVDQSVGAMTKVALSPVQVEMRALATSADVDLAQVQRQLSTIPQVQHVDRFASVAVVVSAPGGGGRVTARLFAVDPGYLAHHPWVHASGDLRRGALLNPAVLGAPGFASATQVSIDLPGDAPPLGLSVPLGGRVDLRDSTTWFAIPAGAVQGDVAVLPRAIVVDYDTFERAVLPVARKAFGATTAVANPGLSELPPLSVEAHVAVRHAAYPHDPTRAAGWSSALRRVMERSAPGAVIVADNAQEPLAEAGIDATNAKVLFVLLGLPGALVAAALGLAAASALAEAHRREDALLRLRGATDGQLARLALGQSAIAGIAGTALGLAAAGLGVSAVVGHLVWRGLATSRLLLTLTLAVLAGGLTTAARVIPLVRAGRRGGIVVERRAVLEPAAPSWRRGRLDVVALGVGVVVLAVNALAGGLKPLPVEGQAVALSFYALLAPLGLWLGVVLLTVRAVFAVVARTAGSSRPRPLPSWRGTALRWTARRPSRVTAALALGALAVAFGSQVLAFVATYGTAKHADAKAAFGADLRLTPLTDKPQPPPSLGAAVTATTPIRFVPARTGSDRKTIMAIDPRTYGSTVSSRPQIVRGGGVDVLAGTRAGVLVAQEIASTFAVRPGDTLPVTVFPDDLDLAQKLDLHVVGVFRSFAPAEPLSEMVVNVADLPAPVPSPDLYLARSAGSGGDRMATAVRRDLGDASPFSVSTIADRSRLQQRSLTALNLDGLGQIESVVAALVAAIGVGVLGAFLVVERRREFALLRMVGAGTSRLLTGPALEGILVAGGSLVIGIPVGLGLGALAVRVLGLFFALPPPLLTVPVSRLTALAVAVLLSSGVALALALRRVGRVEISPVLREP
jgi:putative ABC transport system permease protein